MTKREKTVRIALAGLFALLGLWLALPVLQRVVHGGMLFLIPLAAGFALAVFPPLDTLLFKKSKGVAIVIIILIILFCLLVAVVSGFILSGFAKPVSDTAGTIIVLGCRVNGETPSTMLQRRADAALDYWRAHPDCDIVVTGALGKYGTISEAEALRRYLVQNGVDDSRIYVEDHSTNTEQNLQYAAALIAQNGLSDDVVIATDRFHQYRASLFAQKHGLTSSPLACRTDFILSFGYWCREILAVTRALIFGY